MNKYYLVCLHYIIDIYYLQFINIYFKSKLIPQVLMIRNDPCEQC